MLKMVLVCGCVLIGGVGAQASDQQFRAHRLLQQERVADDTCRGSADQKLIEQACNLRDVYYEKLTQIGWCYGTEEQIQSEKAWYRCR